MLKSECPGPIPLYYGIGLIILDYRRNIAKFLFVILVALQALPVYAQSRHYGAEMTDSIWLNKKIEKSCRLSHTIPRYGKAEFIHKNTGELGFTMRVRQRAIQSGKAKLRRAKPVWHKNGEQGKNIGKLSFKTGNVPFTLKETKAWQLLNELEQGSILTLIYKDWSGGKGEVSVSLSPVNFLPALEVFHQCTQQLASK